MKSNVNKKQILFLTYYHFPCYEPALENIFAKELGKKIDIYWLFQGNLPDERERKWHNTKILLTKKIMGYGWPIKIMNKIIALQKYYNLLKLLKKEKIDIIIIRDMPLQTILINFLKKFFGFKIYFQYTAPIGSMHISYSKIDRSYKKLWFFFQGISYNIMVKKALKIADIIFPITNFHKEELSRYTFKKKMVPITMGVDEDWINLKRQKLACLHSLKKKYFLLVYFGSLSFGRNSKFILKLFYHTKKQISNCKIALIGKTSSKWELNQLNITCKKLNINNDVIFTGHLDRNKLRSYLSYCDLSICAIPPTNYFRISSPTKLYESLGVGLPVIANKGIYEQEKVITESGGGVITNYEAHSFANEAVKLLNNKALREKMAKNGKNYVLKNYKYSHIAKFIYPYFT